MSKRWLGLLLLMVVWIGGSGVARAAFTEAPDPLAFGNVILAQSKTANATLSASAPTNVMVTVTLRSGGDCSQFQITSPTSAVTVDATTSQTVTVQFTPSSTGNKSCTVDVKNGGSTIKSFNVTGTGVAAMASDLSSIAFGPVQRGTTRSVTFTLSAPGGVPVTITSSGLDKTVGYTIDPTTPIPSTVNPTDMIPVKVNFAPASFTDGGTAAITIDGTWGSGNTVSVIVTLTGETVSLSVTSAALDFGNFRFDSAPTRSFQISNDPASGAAVPIATVDFTPDAGTATTEVTRTIKNGTTPVNLAAALSAGQTFDVTVTVTPNNRIGPVSGHFTIHSSAPGVPDQTVMVTGNATAAALMMPMQVDFGPVDIDGGPVMQNATITNTGTAAFDITSIAAMPSSGSPFVIPSMTAPNVAASASLPIPITYQPTMERMPGDFDTAVLVVGLTGALNGPAKAMIPIRGRGIDRHLVVDDTVAFPPANVGSSGSTKAITVQNSGEATLRITALMIADKPVWQLVDTAPVDIPGNSSHDFLVKFVPMAIDSFTGELTLLNNDNGKPMATVKLTGDAVFIDAHGGGGCNAGGMGTGSGAGFVLGTVVFGAIGRRRRKSQRRAGRAVTSIGLTIAVCVLGAIAASTPAAHADGIGITVFAPTPATSGTSFQLQSPDVGPDGSWAAGTILSYASNPLVLDIFTGSTDTHDIPVKHSALLQVGAAYAFLGRFEAGANIPLYMQSGDSFTSSMTSFAVQGANGTARGNLTLHAKARLWRGGLGRFIVGTSALVMLPTASKDQFTGSDKPAAKLLLLGSFTPAALTSRLTISANVGAVLRGKTEYDNIEQQSGVAWGAGTSYRILDKLWATAELFGEATPSGQQQQQGANAMPRAAILSPIEWLAGASYQVDPRFTVGLAVGRGLTNGLGTPDLRGVFSLALVSGGAALAPIHPSGPEGPDGDADGDGIPDSLDKCPNEPEDKDMFEDSDGCPDPDNDHDGIPDDKDKCPLDPEDKDGFQDADGCPDPDNDHDGIPDKLDKCPNDPEDKDGFEDLDGCPDPDNDHDGIPDVKDKCPNEPETINGYQDDDGCPDKGDTAIILSPDRIETLDPIQFNGLKLTRASTPLVEQVGATLRAHTEIVRLRVTVHVQPTGDLEADKAKSDKRAQAVRDWLVQFGIPPARLEARGFGGEKPLVPPDQRGAAKINDRIEFIILERK